MKLTKSRLALAREYARVTRLHRANVHLSVGWKKPPADRDYYMMMGAQQALAWVVGENAARPSLACAPLPKPKVK